MARIRVLEIIHGLAIEGPLGGIERFGVELVRALDGSRIEPILCGLWRYGTPHEGPRLDRLRSDGIQAFLASRWDQAHPYRAFITALHGTRRELAGQPVDLIHSHCQFGDGIALLLARQLRPRALLRTVHNEREWPRRPERRLLLTNLIYPLRFRLEMGVSQEVTENLNRRPLARLTGRRARCMYNAVNLDRFLQPPDQDIRKRKRAELGIAGDALLVGSIGRLTAQKGYSTLLEAAATVIAHKPHTHFLIVGEGDLKDDLHDQARQLGVDRNVHLLGRRLDIEELLMSFDLFVSSSLWEGLPTVIMESMAAGVPIVATDVSGTRELVHDQVTGLLVPPGDPLALARAVQRALGGGDEATVWTRQALGRVEDFSITSVAQQHVELYTSVMQGGIAE